MENKKPRISNGQFKKLLFDNLAKGATQAHKKTPFWQLLAAKGYAIDRDRAGKLFDLYYTQWIQVSQRATERTIVKHTQAATLLHLKSREEVSAFLQSRIDEITKQLNGESEFVFQVGNKIMKSHNNGQFNCPVQVLNDLRRVLKEYTSELSKLNGFYAPQKIAQTDSEGMDIDTSLLSQSQRENLVLIAAQIFK